MSDSEYSAAGKKGLIGRLSRFPSLGLWSAGLVIAALLMTAANGTGPSHALVILCVAGAISLLLLAVFRDMRASHGRALELARRMSADYAENAERYRKLFDEATAAIAFADAETGTILDINNAMERLTGWDKSELIGKSQKILHPPEPEPASVTAVFEQHRSGRGGELVETQLVTRDGTVRDVEIKAISLDLNGKKALAGFFRDITERKQYEQDIYQSNELLERIFANIRTLIAYLDADFNFIRVNRSYAAADGHDPEYFVGKNHFELYPNQENERIFRGVVASGEPYSVYARPFVYEHNRERGVTYWDWNVQPVKDRQGRVAGLVLSLLDRTEEKRAEERLRLFARALDASVNSIAIVDATREELPLIYVNPAFTVITGYSAEEVLGRNPGFLKGTDRDQPELENIRRAVRDKQNGQALLRNYRKDGSLYWNELFVSPVWDDAGNITHFIGVARDISQRKTYEAELERLYNFDALTGLPNHNLLKDRLAQAIVHAHRNAGVMAVAVLALDGLKEVNDGLGHHAGDLMLQEVAYRLTGCAREGDTVARQGADEFVVVMPELSKEQDAVVIAEKLLGVFAAPIRCGTQELFITASIGIAVYPRDGEDAESMLKHGDLALHRTREKGTNSYQFYAPEMNRRVSESLSLGNGLHRALERDEFILHYQPQVDLHSGRIVGVEALLRWQNPESGGLVPPDQFIPIAEENGLIVPIGIWVLQQACLTAMAWHNQGFNITVAVNLSARQLREPGLVMAVQDALGAAGLEARFLELELTESVLVDQAEFVLVVLRQLREMGVQLSLDDFGTGYSSLSYLKRFPIGRIKIDRSFVRDIISDPEDAAIVGAIISMAHNLKLKVIAEGVENSEQQAFLRSRLCDEIQGYYFSKPLPAHDITTMLQRGIITVLNGDAGEQAPALLLVDDEKDILSSLARVFRRDGYRILRTSCAKDAFAMLASNEVAVIVADQRMPEMCGVEFLRRARQLHPDSVRLLLSGNADLQSLTEALNEGAVYKFISKPWDDDVLRDNIRDAFHRYAMKKERASLVKQLASANEELVHAKQLLEQKVDEQMQESLRNLDVLQASREVLECLPVGVIWVDEGGLIAEANKKADELLCVETEGILPPALNELMQKTLRESSGEFCCWKNPQGEEFACWSHRIGESSQAQGGILVIEKIGPDAGLAENDSAAHGLPLNG